MRGMPRLLRTATNSSRRVHEYFTTCSRIGVRHSLLHIITIMNCVWVSHEDEVVLDTGAHRDQLDGVGVLLHRRQEATKPLTQNSKGISNDTSGTRQPEACLLYTSPSPRDLSTSRMPSSA